MDIKLRRIWAPALIALVVAAGPIAFLDYFLPHHTVLKVVGTDIKRTASATTPTGSPYDVRYIYAVQATARAIANEGGTAALTYYGWRIQIISLYPNVVKIKRAEPGTWIIPWFNIVFFGIVIGGSLWLTLWFRGFRNRRRLARGAPRAKPSG
jgi:hypothetical protein